MKLFVEKADTEVQGVNMNIEDTHPISVVFEYCFGNITDNEYELFKKDREQIYLDIFTHLEKKINRAIELGLTYEMYTSSDREMKTIWSQVEKEFNEG